MLDDSKDYLNEKKMENEHAKINIHYKILTDTKKLQKTLNTG